TSDDDPDELLKLQGELNEQARKTGLLTTGVTEVIRGASCMPVVAVKTFYDINEGPKFVKKQTKMRKFMHSLGLMDSPFTLEEEYDIISEGPNFEILNFVDFLYDYEARDIASGRGVCHRMFLTRQQLELEAPEREYNPARVQELIELGPYQPEGPGDTDAPLTEAMNIERYIAGRMMICEWWIPVETKGRLYTHVFAIRNNKIPLYGNKKGKRSGLGPMRYPFATYRTNKKFNELEGIPWITQAKPLCRMLSDCFNIFADAFNYGIFPTIIAPTDVDWEEEPYHSPGGVWYADDPEKIKVIERRLGDLKIITWFVNEMSLRIKNLFNAPAEAQGAPSDPKEKATKTALRATGTATRSRGVFKEVGDFIIEVAQQYIYHWQSAGEVKWLIDAKIDVPALTNIHPREIEIQIWLALLAEAKQNPLYNNPMGIVFLREITKKVYELNQIKDSDNYVPSEEHLEVMYPQTVAIDYQADQLKKLKEQRAADESIDAEGELEPGGGSESVTKTFVGG
ncbi:hypothetical protein KAR91_77990, partial [Candidatus Pacearchaeota archaeon]|nr:hypothetical protein [Candidatus Pacearchaeota archaeon]